MNSYDSLWFFDSSSYRASDTHRHPEQSTVDQDQEHGASLELLVLCDVVHLGPEACSVCEQRKHLQLSL